MGRIKRGGYIFYWWIGDHGYHVHVKQDGKLVVKWDLERNYAIKGEINHKILKIIESLKKEGVL